MLSSNMDRGVTEFQVEAAISKVFASVSDSDFYTHVFRIMYISLQLQSG